MAYQPALNPQPIKVPDVATTGSLAALNAAVTTAVNSQGIVAIQLTGTWVGTIAFQGTEDPTGIAAASTSWFNVNGVQSVSGAQLASTTTNGQYRVNSGGYTAVRAIMTAFTSGSATVWMNASLAPSMATLAEPLPTGTNSIGRAAIDQTTNIIAATTMQNAAVAVGNGVNLNVQGYTTAIVSITGTMSAGTTVSFKASPDDVFFDFIAAHQLGVAGNLVTSTTNIGNYRINCTGFKSVQAIITTYGAGTITAKGTVSVLSGHPTTVNSNIIAALPAGTNTIGKAGIDQTTLGTTNNVSISGATGAGTSNLIKDDTGFGDGVTTGIAASTSRLYNGTTYDRARGDITAGAWVQVKAALPTGANTIGAVSVESGTINIGSVAVAPQFAIITASASGITTLVALTAGKRIRVLALSLVCNAAVNAKFQSSVTPTDISGLYYNAANGGMVLPFNQAGWFQTIAGEALTINLNAAIAVGGSLTYILV